jgi:hypothetical protein
MSDWTPPPPPPPVPPWQAPAPPLADRGRRWWVLIAVLITVVLVGAGAATWLLLSDGVERRGGAGTAQALGCSSVQTYPSEGMNHVLEPPPGGWGTTPATSGVHSAFTYTGDRVITTPVDPELELALVHNLEHAYVIAYYQPEGDTALPAEAVTRLAAMATAEEKVLVAPYPRLPAGTSLALVAWTKMQTCPAISAQDADAVVSMTLEFVERFRGAESAPEPLGP